MSNFAKLVAAAVTSKVIVQLLWSNDGLRLFACQLMERMPGTCRFIAAHKKLSDWLFASLICGFGLPLSFILWYWNLYKGAIRDSSFRSVFHTPACT